MADSSPLSSLSIDKSYGVELLASFVAAILWGIQSLQTFLYFQLYPNDRKILRILVIWTWTMDTVHQGLIISLEYLTLITRYEDPTRIGISKELMASIVFHVLVSIPVQLFFVYRIFVLNNRQRLLPAFLMLCITAETVLAFVYIGYSLLPVRKLEDLLLVGALVSNLGTAFFMLAAFVDVCLAGAMVYLLGKSKVEAATHTQQVVLRLIIYSVNTGLWTALLASAVAITAIAKTGTFIPIGLYIPISALYCNTLLANLNIRTHVRKGMQEVITLSAISPGGNVMAGGSRDLLEQNQEQFEVRITRSITVFPNDSQHEDGRGKVNT